MPSIMIADRDPNERAGINWLLNSWAIPYDQVFSAGTAMEVFQIMENSTPDVICLELDMIARASWDRLKLLIEQYRPIVLVMTAEATFEKAMLGIELHARDLWLKPLTPQTIRRVLTRCCQESKKKGREKSCTGAAETDAEMTHASYRELFAPDGGGKTAGPLMLAQLEDTSQHPELLAFLHAYPFHEKPAILPLPDVIALVFASREAATPVTMPQMGKRLLVEWEASHHTPLSLVIHDGMTSPKSLHEKWEEASQALQLRFFIGYRQVYVIEHPITWSSIDPLLTPAEQRAWIDMLLDGDREAVKMWMYAQFTNLREPYPEPGLLRIRLTSILAQVRRYMKSQGLDAAPLEQEYHRIFETVLYAPILYRVIQEMLLYIFALMDAVQSKENPGRADVVELAIRYMEGKYTDPDLRLEEVARHVDRSPAYFSTLVSTSLGVSFRQLLNNMRLKEAQQLITETSLPIREIAVRSGFSNANYFSKVFKEKLGITPRVYRNRKKR
ncbi:helix-turn-helix domain-containing protein [Brevibacillus panacihumi]|uniref:AraC family transcriptional regulator n=1 Tax=Brevibacillus panacihumi TaxID=497735 RepID=A0A3M8CM33_9BACL|nr:helix-turn-helix domain-containing protein [Brevibacillus panacihumi]RNB76734.1 AraC family transcriptional regulator [Brevibacillus panacihumi]